MRPVKTLPCIFNLHHLLFSEGLRTLAIGQKCLEEKVYLEWKAKYNRAMCDPNNRDELVKAAMNDLELDMELLGVTGVEDKLQDDVEKTIESLRAAGIQVWMLTGDKVETATCIATSAGFKSRTQKLFYMKELSGLSEVEMKIKEFERVTDSLLMIDGHSLDLVLSSQKLEEKFFAVAVLSPSVCVCRCSPTQKALIVKKIGFYTKKRTAAVGDGGNDVGMILESNVGIGIVGKEGKQASLASDFSIN